MKSPVIEYRLRTALLLLSVLVFLVTLVELVLEEHTGEFLQWLPFIFCGIGLVAVLAALVRPQRTILIALRIAMCIVALGGMSGVIVHLLENLAFEQEIRPNANVGELIMETLKGASPLLAPGILTFAAIIALLATYYHPALGNRTPESKDASA